MKEHGMSQSSGTKDRSTGSGSLLLHVSHPDGQSDEIYLARGLTIGRADHNQIILADQDAVARTHARVEIDQDGSYRLRCTAEGGELLGDSGPVQVLHLSPGTCFRIGDTAFECVSGRAPNVAPTTEAKQRCPYCHAAPPALLPAGQSPCPVCSRLLFGVDSPGGQPPWLAPASFGHVTANRFVACGGMGVVLQGTGAETGQPVAIKLIRHDRHAGAAAKDRFAQEIAAMTRLDHDNVVKLLESGEEAGFDYLVMEWVEGRTLRDAIRSRAVARSVPEFADVADWFLDIAAALEAIHSLGLIHRDVKPSNILIDQQNRARLTDLGLVRRADRTTGGLTTTGDAPGTWEYMAPEQASSPDLVTCRADYYSLAVTFYELLTGHRPVGAWQPPSKTNPSVPPEFDRILETMLQPDPFRRLDNLAAAMEQVRDLVTPKWSYRYVARLWLAPVARFVASFAPNWIAQEGARFWNCLIITNESAMSLEDVVVTGTAQHTDGSREPIHVHLKRLETGQSHKINSPFVSYGSAPIAYFEANMTCSRGPANLRNDVAVTAARAKKEYQKRIALRNADGGCRTIAHSYAALIDDGTTPDTPENPYERAREAYQLEYSELLADRRKLNRLSLAFGLPGFLLSTLLTPFVWTAEPSAIWWLISMLAPFSAALFLVGLACAALYKGRHPCWSFLALLFLPGLIVFLFLTDRRAPRLRELERLAGPGPMASISRITGESTSAFPPPHLWSAIAISVIPCVAPLALIFAVLQFRANIYTVRLRQWWVWGIMWTGFRSLIWLLEIIVWMILGAIGGTAGPEQEISDGMFCLTLPSGWTITSPRGSEGPRLTASDPNIGLHLTTFAESRSELQGLTLQEYAVLKIDLLKDSVQGAVREGLKDSLVGGLPAIQGGVEWIVNEQVQGMVIVFVESPTHYWCAAVEGNQAAIHANMQTIQGIFSTIRREDTGISAAPPQAVAPFNAAAARGYQEAWARYLGQPVEMTNSIGMKLALIPPGEFMMGSPASEADRSNDETQHRVRITKPYYLGMYEVTVGQFRSFVTARSFRTEAERDGKGGYGLGADGIGRRNRSTLGGTLDLRRGTTIRW
jgi:serine/threonine protein kinase